MEKVKVTGLGWWFGKELQDLLISDLTKFVDAMLCKEYVFYASVFVGQSGVGCSFNMMLSILSKEIIEFLGQFTLVITGGGKGNGLFLPSNLLVMVKISF